MSAEFRGRVYDGIVDTIGATPLVRLKKLAAEAGARADILAKCEFFNPLGSVKDRIGAAMIEAAERDGRLRPGTVLVEPTSGNTGIALAFVCAAKGYRLIITMPDSMSVERRKMLRLLGAELELTPAAQGVNGAIAKAAEIVRSLPDALMLQQFENPANPEIHRRTTAQEIIRDFPEGLDFLITGVGTGGHISAVSEVLKKEWKGFKTFAVEPAKSPVLSGGQHTPHKIQGVGAGFIPANFHPDVVDGFIQVTEEEAFTFARRAAREEGIFVGPSSGATLAAVAKKLPELPAKSRVLAFCYDTGERYLSVEGLFD